jgi:glycosyltransferase involved in cell wall biosynthesis
MRVNLTADFADQGGWGRQARAFGAALRQYAEVALCGSRSDRSDRDCPEGDVALPFDDPPFPDALGLALGSVAFLPRVLGAPSVLSTVWETSRVPPPFVAALRGADEIWVPTEWGRQIFLDAGLAAETVHVVPEGVDSELFRPAPALSAAEVVSASTSSYSAQREDGVFRFVSVGKWEERKGSANLVRAFAREFAADEPVELVMHCHNIYLPWFDLRTAIATELEAAGSRSARVVASGHRSLRELIRLMQGADAFVLATRAEAWGLPILEAMACGLPCLVTDCGGHRAFADETNAYLIEVDRHVPVHDPLHFDARLDWGTWAEPSTEHLQHLMRHVCDHRDEARERGDAARRAAADRWSWGNAAAHAARRLDALARR